MAGLMQHPGHWYRLSGFPAINKGHNNNPGPKMEMPTMPSAANVASDEFVVVEDVAAVTVVVEESRWDSINPTEKKILWVCD